jgi:hypothetical protein
MNFLILNCFSVETKLGLRAQHALGLPRPGHHAEQAWVVQPRTGLAGYRTRPASARSARMVRRGRPRTRSERVPWHGSRWFTGGYSMAKLRTNVDLSNGPLPGTAWPKVEAVDRARGDVHGATRCVRG